MESIKEALTFDDVLLVPNYNEALPEEIEIKTKLTSKIQLNIPIISAAMDSVTEAKTAICMAREGGLGVIHKNMPIQRQVQEVIKVKKAEHGMIVDPVVVHPKDKLFQALELMNQHNISGLPVVEEGYPKGILTARDIRFAKNLNEEVRLLMTKDIITVPEGISIEKCKDLLHQHRIEKLLVINEEGKLVGLITFKDLVKAEKYPNAAKDPLGRLLVGAAIGVKGDQIERTKLLLEAGCDIIVIDVAHGYSKIVIDFIRTLKYEFPEIQIIAGNVATKEGCEALIKAGADAVKVGLGPGSICTTRVIAGVGVPQITAIFECAQIAKKFNIPIIADGGIKFSGDIVKAIACGANSVMIGSLFAGTDESPGEIVLYQGRSYKVYRGMGSISAMRKGSGDRYFQFYEDESKMVPEGIEGRVPYRGSLSSVIFQLIGGLKAGMKYTGCKNIEELQTQTKFIRITQQGLKESHVHDVIITEEAPNYRIEI
jgi:IMP dehydrogenase